MASHGVRIRTALLSHILRASPAPQKRNTLKFALERVIGNGSFGTVFEAKIIETGETVAIKKVLQDRRFKVRVPDTAGLCSNDR